MYQIIKRMLDIILCILALIVLSPIFLFTIIGIELSSPGTVFYHSTRAGKDKKPFKFYKFRSMHPPKGKKKDMFIADPDRVFKFGKLIRRLKIDELPQLINVIKGDMSIVGPRPMTVEHVDELYSGKYEIVSKVKPGLTSPASLYDYTVGDTYKDNKAYLSEVLPIKLELEKIYVEQRNLWYDCKLIWRTIITIIQVLFGRKKYISIPELSNISKNET